MIEKYLGIFQILYLILFKKYIRLAKQIIYAFILNEIKYSLVCLKR